MLIIRGQHIKKTDNGEVYLNEKQYFWRISKNTYSILNERSVELGDLAYVSGGKDHEVLITGIYEVSRDYRPMHRQANDLKRVLQVIPKNSVSSDLLKGALV